MTVRGIVVLIAFLPLAFALAFAGIVVGLIAMPLLGPFGARGRDRYQALLDWELQTWHAVNRVYLRIAGDPRWRDYGRRPA